VTARAAFHSALDAARDWHAALPAMAAFTDWPDDLRYAARAPVSRPVLPLMERDPGHASPQSARLQAALLAAAPHAEWRLTYTEEEVGRDFLNRFAWFELAGPDGHFVTDQCRITVAYWGRNLFYARHWHEPEELYTVVSGSGIFMVDNQPDLILGPGDTRLHLSNQPHALRTQNDPILVLVIWRGAGLADDPRMVPEDAS